MIKLIYIWTFVEDFKHLCYQHTKKALICIAFLSTLIGASLSEPHTSESDGTSDRLRTITIKHGKLVYSSIDNLNYTEKSRNGLLTIYLTEMAH